MIKSFFISLLTLGLLTACSASIPKAPKPENIDSSGLLNEVSLGMTRAKVEALLGKPYSVEEKHSKVPGYNGIEVTVLYSPKLRSLETQLGGEIKANQNIQTTKSILGGVLSILSSILPGAGVASSVSGTAVNMAGDLASAKIDPASLDPAKIESAIVVYHKDVVESITRNNLSVDPS